MACTLLLQLLSAWHVHHWQADPVPAFDTAEHQHCMLCHVPLVLVEPSSAEAGILLEQTVPSVLPTSEGEQYLPVSPTSSRAPPFCAVA